MNAIKKTNPKRLLSMLLVLMMVLTMLPLTAWADGGVTVKIGTTPLESGKYYTVKSGETSGETSGDTLEAQEGSGAPSEETGYAHWDADSNTLTLNNFKYTLLIADTAIEITGGNCTIKMEGEQS